MPPGAVLRALRFAPADAYTLCTLVRKPPEPYAQLGLRQDMPIYAQFVRDPDAFRFVSRPQLAQEAWKDFTP